MVERTFSKPLGQDLVIEVEILLKGLLKAQTLGLSNLLVEGDSTIVITWVTKKERGPWKFEEWLHQIFIFLQS